MDFFESQEVARRNTRKLVLLFVLAVITLVAITNLLVMATLGVMEATADPGGQVVAGSDLVGRLDWPMVAWISVAVVAVVAFGSLYKIVSLSGGGARVAEMMQARLLVDGNNDADEQKVLNVVEEMAIASGTPVPPVYVMEEEAINAFAAGYSPSDAVIGVTRGAIRKLSRDELQGVIAHEFSHILHGDMRINIRLIGILHGIMVLGLMGYYLMRSAAFSRRSRNGGQVIFLGLGLMVIGFTGTLFGNLIKSAVSRQREYLADASAVQYTRNPRGIAGALKRIGADAQGSVLENPGASEISHALFGNGVKRGFNALFATHPPLEKRIGRLQPDWDGSFASAGATEQEASTASAQADDAGAASGREEMVLGALAAVAMGRVGTPGPDDLAHARTLHATLPERLLQAAHQPWAARALVYRLQLADDEDVRRAQLLHLQREADSGVHEEVQALLRHEIPAPDQRLALVHIALSALRQLSPAQYGLFRDNLRVLESLDSETGLARWAVRRIVVHELDSVFEGRRGRGRLDLSALRSELTVLLSWLARASGEGRKDGAWRAAVTALEVDLPSTPAEDLSLEALDAAVEKLARLKPLAKPRVLKACAAGIAADQRATLEEQALLRAVSEVIDCPMPPLDVRSGQP